MNIYVASSWRNLLQQGVVHTLRAAGHDVYDFKQPEAGNNGFHWSAIDGGWQQWTPERYRDALGHPIALDGYGHDRRAMEAADACVLVLPCGRSAHLEAGWLAGRGKPVFVLIVEQCEPELMYRLAMDSGGKVCVNFDELLQAVGVNRPDLAD